MNALKKHILRTQTVLNLLLENQERIQQELDYLENLYPGIVFYFYDLTRYSKVRKRYEEALFIDGVIYHDRRSGKDEPVGPIVQEYELVRNIFVQIEGY